MVSRPVPGGGSRLSLGESPDAKSRRGESPAPPGKNRSLGLAPSFGWVASGTVSFWQKCTRPDLETTIRRKNFFAGSCSVEKSSLKKSQKRKSPNQGTYRPRRVPPAAAGGIHSNLFFARTCAGQKTLLSPRVPGPARRGSGCKPLILEGAASQAENLTPPYTTFSNEAAAPVPLPKFYLIVFPTLSAPERCRADPRG